jgi:hypothetical protein
MAAMGQMVPQQMMAQGAAPAGFAAIPTLPTNTAITLTFDIIKIPIPIPRIRTVDVPPETRLSFVQLGASASLGAVAAPPVAPMAVAPVSHAAFVQPAAVEAQAECIRPEHIAAAAALVRAQAAQGASQGASATTAATDERLERASRELEKANQAIDKLEKALDSKLKAGEQSEAHWRKSDRTG